MTPHFPKPPGEQIVELLRENTKLLREVDERQERHGAALEELLERTGVIVTSVEEVTQALETLKTDLEAKAAEAKAEFEKLETEVKEGHTEPELTPLKEAIDSLDASVKGAEVPTD